MIRTGSKMKTRTWVAPGNGGPEDQIQNQELRNTSNRSLSLPFSKSVCVSKISQVSSLWVWYFSSVSGNTAAPRLQIVAFTSVQTSSWRITLAEAAAYSPAVDTVSAGLLGNYEQTICNQRDAAWLRVPPIHVDPSKALIHVC